MEWIIGLIVIWLIWRLLTQKRIEETISEKTIFNIFLNNPGEMINTKISWEDAKKFALEREGSLNVWDDGGESISCRMEINNEEVTVVMAKSRLNGKTTFISVENSKILEQQVMDKLGIKIKNR